MVSWFVPILTAVIAGVGGYFLRVFDKRKERETEEYRRKEERYVNFINSLHGFTVGDQDKILREIFLKELRLAWLYCPDDVIKKANRFLFLVHTDRSASKELPSDQEKEEALGELILAVRKDLLSRSIVKRTALQASDFKIYKAT